MEIMETLSQLGQNLKQYLLDNTRGKEATCSGFEVRKNAYAYLNSYLGENNFNTNSISMVVDKEPCRGSWTFLIKLSIDSDRFNRNYITIGYINVKRTKAMLGAFNMGFVYNDFEVFMYNSEKTLLEKIYDMEETAAKRKQAKIDMLNKAKALFENIKKQNNLSEEDTLQMLRCIVNTYWDWKNQ